MSNGKAFRLTLPVTPRPPSRPRTPLLCSEDTVLDNKIDTDSDESTVSVLSKSLKRKLPAKDEKARQSASPYRVKRKPAKVSLKVRAEERNLFLVSNRSTLLPPEITIIPDSQNNKFSRFLRVVCCQGERLGGAESW